MNWRRTRLFYIVFVPLRPFSASEEGTTADTFMLSIPAATRAPVLSTLFLLTRIALPLWMVPLAWREVTVLGGYGILFLLSPLFAAIASMFGILMVRPAVVEVGLPGASNVLFIMLLACFFGRG